MKKNYNAEIDTCLNGFPDNFVKIIKSLLDDKNFKKKHNARVSLVKSGKTILPYLHKLLLSGNVTLRMEAAKVVELIADRRSIPELISLLGDTEFDIRWIAAQGLIKIGRRSILPLLKSIRDGKSSYFHNKSAHQVLVSLLNDKEKEKLMLLLLSIEDYHELGGTAPTEASAVLKTIFKCNT